jgi:EAL domain-containing protein (putative c-di-GMP-specific phosphodiesterase class I)
VELAIDDFGTGYSSLSYLEHFPLDVLKIDRSFVNQIGNNGDGLAILKAISTLGQTLGVRMIAEGIETTEQLTQLRALECQIGQGYHFAKPLAADAVEALLQQNPHWK